MNELFQINQFPPQPQPSRDLEELEQLEDEEEEEVDDDSEVISKLLEADEDSGSDEDFFCSVDATATSGTRRRPTRRCWSYFKSGNDRSSPVPDEDKLVNYTLSSKL